MVRWSVCDTIPSYPAGLFYLEFWDVGRDGCGPFHRDVFALPFLFSVLLAFLGVDVFFFSFPKGTLDARI